MRPVFAVDELVFIFWLVRLLVNGDPLSGPIVQPSNRRIARVTVITCHVSGAPSSGATWLI